MTDDIVKRLRGLADCDARAGEPLGKCMRQAADEIERLRVALNDAVKIAKAGWLTASCGTIGDADYGNELCEYIAEAISARAALERKP